MLNYILKLSHISYESITFLQNYDWNADEIDEWTRKKIKLNRSLNIETYAKIKKIKDKKIVNNEMIDLYFNNLLLEHLKSRYLLVSKLPKNFRKKIIINLWSISYYYANNIVLLLKIIKQSFYGYKTLENQKASSILITKNFPAHSFNYTKEKGAFPSSFAEYVLIAQNNDFLIISLDEFVRRSKVQEDKSNKTYSNKILNINRLNINSYPKISFLISNCGSKTFLKQLFNLKTISLVSLNFYLSNVLHALINVKYERFINKLKIDTASDLNIYVLPYDIQLSAIDNELIKKMIITYNYSENIILAPSIIMSNNYSNQCKNDLIGDFQYNATNLYKNKIIGFTFIPALVNKIFKTANINIIESEDQTKLNNAPDTPMTLGFESVYEESSFNKSQITIAIFDNPPESIERQLEKTLFGEITANYKYISEFLLDICDCAENKINKINIIIKSKYSLSNYDTGYSNLLLGIKDRLGSNCEIIDPYLRMSTLVDHCDATISTPYSSTKKLFETFGIPSLIYIPDKFIPAFDYSFYKSGDLLLGKSQLNSFIQSLIEKPY